MGQGLAGGADRTRRVKGCGGVGGGKVESVMRGDRLVDDRAVIIAGLFTDEGLGPTLRVVDEGTYKRVAAHDVSKGKEVYSAAFSMHPTARTHWRPYLVAREGLGARLLGGEPPVARAEPSASVVGMEPRDRHDSWLGFLGESEVVRRLAESAQLDLFRPFPDLAMVEVLARDNVNGRFVGLQVKTAVPAKLYGEAHIHLQKATFVPTPSAWVVGLAWLPALGRFAEEFLLVPTEHLREIAVDGGDHYVLTFHPESPERTPLDPYRQRLTELGVLVGRIAANASR